MNTKIYTVNEVAEVLKVGRKLVYEIIQMGQLKCIRIGRCIRIPECYLDEFINSGENQEI
jgi:excisionase family DNA binding protein